jgi:hypothetical protein
MLLGDCVSRQPFHLIVRGLGGVAENVPLCFSFASMNIVKTSSAVKIASINTPCAKLVPSPNVVLTLKLVGKSTLTKKLANILPLICADSNKNARTGLSARHNNIANVTAGLNRPPLMRKKTQTLTISEKAKTMAM